MRDLLRYPVDEVTTPGIDSRPGTFSADLSCGASARRGATTSGCVTSSAPGAMLEEMHSEGACVTQEGEVAEHSEPPAHGLDWRADERERVADERERKADDREQLANERERRADEREAELNRMAEGLGIHLPGAAKRAFEALDRARSHFASASDQVDRAEEALRRAAASADRSQAEINKEIAHSELELSRGPLTAQDAAERASLLRKRLIVLAAELADAEEVVARGHDEQAVRQPDRSAELRRLAAEARERARRASEIGRLARPNAVAGS